MIYNELRIGNMVSDGDDMCYIQSFNTKFANVRDTKIYSKESIVSKELIKNLQGVNITKEFLLSVGFTSPKENTYHKGELTLYEHSENEFEVLLSQSETFIKTIEFVHELENLYYNIMEGELW